jgi:hypothetical protein
MFKTKPIFLAGLLLFVPAIPDAQDSNPSFAHPKGYFFSTAEASNARTVRQWSTSHRSLPIGAGTEYTAGR